MGTFIYVVGEGLVSGDCEEPTAIPCLIEATTTAGVPDLKRRYGGRWRQVRRDAFPAFKPTPTMTIAHFVSRGGLPHTVLQDADDLGTWRGSVSTAARVVRHVGHVALREVGQDIVNDLDADLRREGATPRVRTDATGIVRWLGRNVLPSMAIREPTFKMAERRPPPPGRVPPHAARVEAAFHALQLEPAAALSCIGGGAPLARLHTVEPAGVEADGSGFWALRTDGVWVYFAVPAWGRPKLAAHLAQLDPGAERVFDTRTLDRLGRTLARVCPEGQPVGIRDLRVFRQAAARPAGLCVRFVRQGWLHEAGAEETAELVASVSAARRFADAWVEIGRPPAMFDTRVPHRAPQDRGELQPEVGVIGEAAAPPAAVPPAVPDEPRPAPTSAERRRVGRRASARKRVRRNDALPIRPARPVFSRLVASTRQRPAALEWPIPTQAGTPGLEVVPTSKSDLLGVLAVGLTKKG